jgi:hypothetical protein
MPSRILQITICLVLASVSTALAQIHYDLTNEIQFVSAGVGPQVASVSRCVSTGDLTNQHLTFLTVPAPKADPDSGLSWSMPPPSQQTRESELNLPNLPGRVRLADLIQTTSPHGWRIGDDGILSYRTQDRRCHLVFRYTPDIRAVTGDLGRLEYFSLAWQFSLGKLKPAK